MTNMIERVAMLIAEEISGECFTLCGAEERYCMCRIDAASIIKAMRDPTGEMVEAGAWQDDGGGYFVVGDASATSVWQAMIDAALTPKIEE